MSDHTGQLDRYGLIHKLDSGAFGQVYLAGERINTRNAVSGRQAAWKL